MGWILRDFECQSCGEVFEALTWTNMEEDEPCPVCTAASAKPLISAPKPASYSLMSKDDQAKCLRKRSRQHTLKELKKDPTQVKMSRHLKM